MDVSKIYNNIYMCVLTPPLQITIGGISWLLQPVRCRVVKIVTLLTCIITPYVQETNESLDIKYPLH